jgi:ATP-dependent Clp protease adaptor protein ClpS|tara:strand:+ start:133 stop:444 length:312 start_codon:yes stop_codon:yes gene_type:complete
MNMSTDTEVIIDEKIKQETLMPKKFNVILLDDNSTPMDWVVNVLVSIFKHTETTSQQIMLKVHNEGSAVCGTYNYEIAEQKSVEAVKLSSDHGFPLQLRLEQE